jgi:hypothetical protein
MASEAEAGVQARAKVILSQGEQEASRRLVEAANGSTPISMHLNYLQAVTKVSCCCCTFNSSTCRSNRRWLTSALSQLILSNHTSTKSQQKTQP